MRVTIVLLLVFVLVGCGESVPEHQYEVLFEAEGPIRSSAVVDAEVIFVGDNKGNLYAWSLKENTMLWQYTLDKQMCSKVLVVDDAVYAISRDHLHALDKTTGEVKWIYADDTVERGMRYDQWDYHDSSPVLSDGVIYYGTSLGSVNAVDVVSGELVTTIHMSETNPYNAPVRTTPLIVDELMYLADYAGYVYCIDMTSMNITWSADTGGAVISELVFEDERLFLAGRSTNVDCYDRITGELLWSFEDPVDNSWVSGTPAIIDDVIYIGSSDSYSLYALNKTNGMLLSQNPTSYNVFSRPIEYNGYWLVADGHAYENSLGGLQAYNIEELSEPVWRVDFGTTLFAEPLLYKDKLYIGGHNGSFYQINLKHESLQNK